MKKLRLITLVSFLLVAGVVNNSCYGPFKLTSKLHSWNSTVGSKWANTAVFFALFVSANMFARMATYFNPFMRLALTAMLTLYFKRKYRRHVLALTMIGYFVFLSYQLYISQFIYSWVLS